ncbi:hypothetical protein GGX14DRAFT_598835 [Mycena pura]|uniref:DNA repair protein Rad26 n=1 Tax=Mycena pura TaxID=153505 RepID=A0AAD6VP40_9AGAR|nr:hypothetical protein GGX14DRAFT_598835 [Mycena pura]
MDGSDDYFFDDIVLDDTTLAVLDSEERKYLSQAVPPPAKRQKTDTGWKPVVRPGHANAVANDNEDLPEISVGGDGSYTVRSASRSTVLWNTHVIPLPPQRVPVASDATPHHSHPQQPLRPRGTFHPTIAHMRVPQAHDSQQVAAPEITQDQIEELRKKLQELQKENENYQKELKGATDAKLAKQGEVSILRKGMEKVAQDHAEQIAKLKQAKEEAEAKQIALQKEMNAEMERLKTQFIFKQHELDGSSRKPPLSVRSKRVSKDFFSTPIAVSTQVDGWNRTELPEHTPLPAGIARRSPSNVHDRGTPEKLKKPAKLLGFQNSFIDVTPVRAVRSRPKVDERMVFPTSPIPFPPQINDVTMNDFNDFNDDPIRLEPFAPSDETEDIGKVERFNWKAELTRIILMHSFTPNTSPTLKFLAGLTSPPESREVYSNAVTRILELVASTAQQNDYETSLSGVCRYLTVLAKTLVGTDLVGRLPVSIDALAALLNMLRSLSCSLPMFASFLLAQSSENGDDLDMLEILRGIICEHLNSAKVAHTCPALGNETVGLLESLCWDVKDSLIQRLKIICETEVLMTLLDGSQPPSLFWRATRLLVHVATSLLTKEDPKLSHDLLSSSETIHTLDRDKTKDITRLPHIERLCSYLIDASRKGSEAAEAKSHILTFFGILSVAHADVHAALVGCQALIPSLVAFSTQLTTLVWEDYESFLTDSDTTLRTIRTLNQTLFLLHHLVFGLESTFNLRHRLHYAPSRTFNGITHMFIVTFGRLSSADPPEWLDSAEKLELESMSDMAQDLLDLVIDGPEGDSIWAAYQADSGDPDTDEEDMEAKLMG